MAKIKIAIFTTDIKAISGIQKGITIVAVPEGNKTWQHAVLSFNFSNSEYVVHQSSGQAIVNMVPKLTIFKNYTRVPRPEDGLTPQNIILKAKIDGALALMSNSGIDPAHWTDSDYSNSGSTLEVYVKNRFTLDPEVSKAAAITTKRKVLYPKSNIDWNLTWNSPILTDEEKNSMRHPLDLDIAMSNDDRDCRKIVEKILSTDYYTKNFTLIGLHGNPGGGKTKMVLNDICALNNIPVVAIPCDPMMGVTQLLAQVGPVNQKSVLNEKEVVSLINGLKNRLTLLQQNPQPTDAEVDEATAIISALNNLATSSTQHAELVKTPSILMKCLRNNLPLVVFLDEANCASTQFQNSLAPIISDGIFKDGPEVGRNNGTIKWVLAWNPNTSNTKSFDGKFFDRISFVQVEDVTPEERRAYRLRKILHNLYNTQSEYARADTLISDAKAAFPEHAADLDKIAEQVHGYNASPTAIEWITKKRINQVLGKKELEFKSGTFCSAYLGDAQLDSADKAAIAITEIDKLVEKINDELYVQTKGRDVKSPDRNSFLYISDRNLDIFTDMVFSYSNVEKAVRRYIFDLIPGGNTMKSAQNSGKSGDDNTPTMIADTIYSKLEGDAVRLHNLLFVEISDDEVKKIKEDILLTTFDSEVWKTPAPENEGEFPPVSDGTDAAQVTNPSANVSNTLGDVEGTIEDMATYMFG